MTLWQGILWAGVALALCAGLYALHRSALWLEARGHLYYLRKKPTGGAASFFISCQEFVNPNVKLVHRANEARPKQQIDPGNPEAPDAEDRSG